MNGGLVKCLLFILLFNIVICKKSKLDKLWKKYKKDFEKHYESAEEEAERRKNWEKMEKEINKHNMDYYRGIYKYQIGHNQFSDMTDKEIEKRLGLKQDDEKESGYDQEVDCGPHCEKPLPEYIDWRRSGVVTPVKDQGKCGAGYAFCTIAGVEAHYALKTNYLRKFSEQEIIDCSRKYGNHGCKGGTELNSLKYFIGNKGITTEKDYPYKRREQKKCYSKNLKKRARVRSYRKLISEDEENLKTAVGFYGPVITSIETTHKFYFFKKGVFHSDKCKPGVRNHCVLIVGYGVEDDTPYWLIKNSWGYNFGEDGYAKMIRNVKNQCSIASYPILPAMY